MKNLVQILRLRGVLKMSSVTVTVYDLERNNFDFGLADYEIFDEEYRPILNRAILDYFRWYEIGYDNPMKWRERINTKLNRIMREKYNALYIAKKTEFNPLFNIDITETFEHEIEQTNTNSTNSTTTNNYESTNNTLSLNSNLPSDELTEDDLTSNLFVDNAQKGKNNTVDTSTDTNETNDSGTNTQTESYTRKQLGSSAGLPFSKALIQLKQFYDKYDLDRQVCEELKEFFILAF